MFSITSKESAIFGQTTWSISLPRSRCGASIFPPWKFGNAPGQIEPGWCLAKNVPPCFVRKVRSMQLMNPKLQRPASKISEKCIFVSYTDALLKEGKKHALSLSRRMYIYIYVYKSFSRQMFHWINSSLVNTVKIDQLNYGFMNL